MTPTDDSGGASAPARTRSLRSAPPLLRELSEQAVLVAVALRHAREQMFPGRAPAAPLAPDRVPGGH